jgi:hypothetical protein
MSWPPTHSTHTHAHVKTWLFDRPPSLFSLSLDSRPRLVCNFTTALSKPTKPKIIDNLSTSCWPPCTQQLRVPSQIYIIRHMHTDTHIPILSPDFLARLPIRFDPLFCFTRGQTCAMLQTQIDTVCAFTIGIIQQHFNLSLSRSLSVSFPAL